MTWTADDHRQCTCQVNEQNRVRNHGHLFTSIYILCMHSRPHIFWRNFYLLGRCVACADDTTCADCTWHCCNGCPSSRRQSANQTLLQSFATPPTASHPQWLTVRGGKCIYVICSRQCPKRGRHLYFALMHCISVLPLFLPPSWRHAHAHFGFAHRQQPLRWLKPFLKHWYVKLYELIAPHTLKWINSVIKLGHFVWNIIYCLSRIKFKDRWVIFFIYDSFCWTKSPTAASLGSRNDAL